MHNNDTESIIINAKKVHFKPATALIITTYDIVTVSTRVAEKATSSNSRPNFITQLNTNWRANIYKNQCDYSTLYPLTHCTCKRMLKNFLISVAHVFGRPTVLTDSSSGACLRLPQSTRKLQSLARPQCADSALCLGVPSSSSHRLFSSPAGSGDEDKLLPDYAPRLGEALEVKRARLLYQSRFIAHVQ